jgi:hypothetical protein
MQSPRQALAWATGSCTRLWTLALTIVAMWSAVTVAAEFAKDEYAMPAMAAMVCLLAMLASVLCASAAMHERAAWWLFPRLFLWFVAGGGVVYTMSLGCVDPRQISRHAACRNNLKEIGLALQRYHEHYDSFPPAFVADAAGKPVHSWRVLILPYLEQNDLYQKYDFQEPWDGPNNKKLLENQPPEYVCPAECYGDAVGRQGGRVGCTSYLAVVGETASWKGSSPAKLSDLRDGASKTVLVVDAANPNIAWTEPRDLSLSGIDGGSQAASGITVSAKHPYPHQFFFNDAPGYGVWALLADGSVCEIPPRELEPQSLKRALTVGAGGYDRRNFETNAASPLRSRVNWWNCFVLVTLVASGYLSLRRLCPTKPVGLNSE